MFRIGDKVGDYEIVAQLKSGGMATLFLGRRAGAAGFAKHVAIKVVHEHLANDDSFVQMFVDEARLGARIQHPNVVHVEELRETGGRLFLVMEYVYGCSLGQFLHALARRRRRLSPELAAHIALKVADGLHAAHELRDSRGQNLGVVHRDISPQNVLLAYQGNIKLIDFGVAKARGRMAETERRSIKGKFRYMSPEQAYAREIDRRTDVYALGVVLWEMLAMRRRFDGRSDAALINQVRHPDPIPPSKHFPGVPPALDAVVLKATAPDADDRYQSAHQLREALVEAVPRAAALHESVLGELLAVVMADHIEQRKSQLPSGVSGLTVDIPSGESLAAEEALHTLTIATADIELLGDSPSDPTGPPQLPTKVMEGAEGKPKVTTVVEPELADAPLQSAPPPPIEPGPRDGVPLPVVLAAIAVILLGLGGLSVLAVYLVRDDDPAEPTATELPTHPVANEPAVASDAGPVIGATTDPPDEPTEISDATDPAGEVEGADATGDEDSAAPIDEPATTSTEPDPPRRRRRARRRRATTRQTTTGRRRRPIADTW